MTKHPYITGRGTVLACAFLVFMTGCFNGRRSEYDPLVGGRTLPAEPLVGRGEPLAPANTRPDQPLPLYPPSPSGNSPAELAGTPTPGTPRTGPTPPSPPASVPNDSRPWWLNSNGSSPDTGRTPIATPISTTGATTPAAGIDSFEQAMRLLDERRVTFRTLTYRPESSEWEFICAIPHPSEPATQRKYEARAAGDNGLAAIRAVLDKIDTDQRR